MTTNPYDQATDEAFDQIINHARHPGGRTMTRLSRSGKDQMMLMLGCGGMTLMIALAVAAVTLAWRLG